MTSWSGEDERGMPPDDSLKGASPADEQRELARRMKCGVCGRDLPCDCGMLGASPDKLDARCGTCDAPIGEADPANGLRLPVNDHAAWCPNRHSTDAVARLSGLIWRAKPNPADQCTGQTWRDYAENLEQAWGARGVELIRVAEVLAAARIVVDLKSGDGIKGLTMALAAYDALERESPVSR
jgi:hypothetical protein